MQCSDGSSRGSSTYSNPSSSPVPQSPAAVPSLPSLHIIPTFESMLTSAVRGSLNLDTGEESGL